MERNIRFLFVMIILLVIIGFNEKTIPQNAVQLLRYKAPPFSNSLSINTGKAVFWQKEPLDDSKQQHRGQGHHH